MAGPCWILVGRGRVAEPHNLYRVWALPSAGLRMLLPSSEQATDKKPFSLLLLGAFPQQILTQMLDSFFFPLFSAGKCGTRRLHALL